MMKPNSPSSDFPIGAYTGVIEGFYGRPWTLSQRRDLCARLSKCGLNSYLYAPKDDLLHRAAWQAQYQGDAAQELRSLVQGCRNQGIRFIYGLAPGLKADASPSGMERSIMAKLQHLHQLGCKNFALMFDDIPAQGFRQHLRRYGSWAGAHIAWTHLAQEHLKRIDPSVRFLFCPTPYCGGFSGAVETNSYLLEVGDKLAPEVDVFWTGRDIVSEIISPGEVQKLARVIRRPPVIWDNLFANDYDLRRLYLGQYEGRDHALKRTTNGILINPNCEYPANFIPIHSFSEFITRSGGKSGNSYERALKAWRPHFRTRDGKLPALHALRCLVDALYLPFSQGATADQALSDIDQALSTTGRQSKALKRFRRHARVMMDWQSHIAELEDRDLAYALYRHVWEIKEEFDLLTRYFNFTTIQGTKPSKFRSMFHRPGTYRGGYASRLQSRLILRSDGGFDARKRLK